MVLACDDRIFYYAHFINNQYYYICPVVRHNIPIDQSAVHSPISFFLIFHLLSMLVTDTTANNVRFYMITESKRVGLSIIKKVSEYGQEIPLSHTADQPRAP